MPPEFANLVPIYYEGEITMKNLDGKEWETGVRWSKMYRSERYHFSSSWPKFRRENNLLTGDECVFKFIKSDGKFCLASHKKPPLPPSETPATKGGDVDVGK